MSEVEGTVDACKVHREVCWYRMFNAVDLYLSNFRFRWRVNIVNIEVFPT